MSKILWNYLGFNPVKIRGLLLKNKRGGGANTLGDSLKRFCEILPKISHLFPTPSLLMLG